MHVAKNSKFSKSIVWAALFLSGTGMAVAADYDGVVIIGDSLSDGGYYSAIGGQRFTTNPGQTAAEYVAEGLGFTTIPSNQGGNNYAQGGARINSDSSSTPPMYAQRPVSTQVTEFITKNSGQNRANTVVLIQGGANDVFQNFGDYANGTISQAQLNGLTQQSGIDLVTQIAKVASTGSRYIIVQNMPNLGVTPYMNSLGAAASAGASQLAQGFNTVVDKGLTQAGVNVVLLDNYRLISEVVANPTPYGFSNATGVACTVSSSLFCSSQTLVSPDAASTYVFADGVHPTTAAQKLSAQYALSVFNAPKQVALVGAAALLSGQRYAQTLQHYVPNSGETTWHTFADTAYAKNDLLSGDSKNTYFLMGADHRLNAQNLRLGATLGYQHSKGSLGSDAGDFHVKEPNVGAYLSQQNERGGMMLYGRYGWLNADVDRKITLGQAHRMQSGSTDGSHMTLGIQGNWNVGQLANGKVMHGPIGGIAYEKVSLDAYDEAGQSSTAMSFGEQKRKGWLMSAGYQLRGNFGRVKPYAVLSYEMDRTKASDVRAHLKSVSSSFSMPVHETDDGARLQLGAQVAITKNMQLTIGAERTFAKDFGQETVVNLGLNAQF